MPEQVSNQRQPPLCLGDFGEQARLRLDPIFYDFFAGGANDEVTLRENEIAFSRLKLLPRVLRNQGTVDTHCSLLGSDLSMPLFLSPTAFHRLAHPDGELGTARAAAATKTLMIVSMASTTSLEDIVESSKLSNDSPGALWFQCYVQPDLGFMKALMERVEAAGFRALVVTVDSPVFGRRERDLRNGFTDLPAGLSCQNMRGPDGSPRPINFLPTVSWDHIDWIRNNTRLPIVLKGILHPEDAVLAVEHGVSALIVSNHGGRQLDTAPATIEVLPAIADAVEGRIPLLLDGGIRRGTDVIKALALGARAVGVGRPVLWGLSVAGEDGVRDVIEMLRAEITQALLLCGIDSVQAVSQEVIHTARARETR